MMHDNSQINEDGSTLIALSTFCSNYGYQYTKSKLKVIQSGIKSHKTIRDDHFKRGGLPDKRVYILYNKDDLVRVLSSGK